jgi:hypothetical protein
MNYKRLGCLLLIILGILLIINGFSSLHEIPSAKPLSEKISAFFTDNSMWNPLIEFFGGTPVPEKMSPVDYKASALVSIAIGVILFLTGILALFFRKKD